MEENLTIKDLENELIILESKKNELEYKIKMCTKSNIRNYLLTCYAATCGLIVDVRVVFMTLIFFGISTALIKDKNETKKFKYEVEKAMLDHEIDVSNIVLSLKKELNGRS